MSYRRVEQAILDSSWAIVPSKLDAICEVLAARIEAGAGAADLSAFAPAEREEPYTTESGVRVIAIRGVMAKRMNLMMAVSGGVSTEVVQGQLDEAIEAPEVRAILLDIDSPGGTVDGSFTLADMVYAARGVKPIVAFGDGNCASAAYLLASAADRIVTNDSALVGSIGIVTMHVDQTAQDAKAGLKKTIIHAGRYKTAGSEGAALDEEGAEYLQSRVDATYTLFVDRVARNLGVGAEAVQTDMADGRIFLGREALGIGLVHEIGERGDALRLAGELADQTREGRTMRGTVMGNIGLVMTGKASEIEGDEDRASAEAIVAKVREQDAALAKAQAAAVAQGQAAVAQALAAAKGQSAASETPAPVASSEAPAGSAPVATGASEAPVDASAIAEGERQRILGIQTCCEKLGLEASAGSDLIANRSTLDAARVALIDRAAEDLPAVGTRSAGSGIPSAPGGAGGAMDEMHAAIARRNGGQA